MKYRIDNRRNPMKPLTKKIALLDDNEEIAGYKAYSYDYSSNKVKKLYFDKHGKCILIRESVLTQQEAVNRATEEVNASK